MSRKIASIGFWVLCFGLVGYAISQTPIGRTIVLDAVNFVAPCSKPIQYRIASVDSRFNLEVLKLKEILAQAEAVWENPVDRNLFEFAENGALEVHLIYDYRQETTERLQKIGVTIDNSEATYEELKRRYDLATLEYNRMKAALDALVARYTAEKNAYEKEVAQWNQRGGAPRREFDRLENTRRELDALFNQIQADQAALNETINNLNAIVEVLNKLARELNLSVNTYNRIGETRGEEFEEGLYKSGFGIKEIHIYEFDSLSRLKRVLAHEMGHALNLPHLDNPRAIMFKLNQGTNETLTPDDIAALKSQCRLP